MVQSKTNYSATPNDRCNIPFRRSSFGAGTKTQSFDEIFLVAVHAIYWKRNEIQLNVFLAGPEGRNEKAEMIFLP